MRLVRVVEKQADVERKPLSLVLNAFVKAADERSMKPT
jgi:hypothetical protein